MRRFTRPTLESDAVSLSERPHTHAERSGGVAVFAFYGTYLVLIPFMGGGLLATGLKLAGIAENPAYTIGFIVASICSVALFVSKGRTEREALRTQAARRNRILSSPRISCAEIRVQRVWRLLDDPDWMPVLLRDESGAYVLVLHHAFRVETLPRTVLTLDFVPPEDVEVFQLHWSGDPLPLYEIQVSDDDEWPEGGAPRLLALDELPMSWQVVVARDAT